jgi:hypothetical protein
MTGAAYSTAKEALAAVRAHLAELMAGDQR